LIDDVYAEVEYPTQDEGEGMGYEDNGSIIKTFGAK
jgi:hypothetical protein